VTQNDAGPTFWCCQRSFGVVSEVVSAWSADSEKAPFGCRCNVAAANLLEREAAERTQHLQLITPSGDLR
jgi:hypothetical protein